MSHAQKQPVYGEGVRIMRGAVITGDVTLAAGCSVWHNAVLRGDVESITVGEGSNIQDGCVLHVSGGRDEGKAPLRIGQHVTVGHMCLLHGCTIGSGTLVGMGSIVMDGADIGEGCIIGAGSLVTQGSVIPAGSMAFGRPAKVVRPLTEEEKQANLAHAREYCRQAAEYPHEA